MGSVLYFLFDYLIFLLNKTYINLIITNTSRYTITFFFIKSFTFIKLSSWTSDKSVWPIYPRHMEQYMWSISLEDCIIFVPSSRWSKSSYSGKIKQNSTNFVSEKVAGPFCSPFLYLSHGPATAKNEKSNGLKTLASFLWLKKVWRLTSPWAPTYYYWN